MLHADCFQNYAYTIQSGFPLKWRKQISVLFQDFSTSEIRHIVLPITTFRAVLIRKHGAEKVTWNIFCWFIIITNAGKLNCKNYSITDLVFQEHTTSQIQKFFRTFSAHLSNFRTFQVLKNLKSIFKFRTCGNLDSTECETFSETPKWRTRRIKTTLSQAHSQEGAWGSACLLPQQIHLTIFCWHYLRQHCFVPHSPWWSNRDCNGELSTLTSNYCPTKILAAPDWLSLTTCLPLT